MIPCWCGGRPHIDPLLGCVFWGEAYNDPLLMWGDTEAP